MIPIFETHDEVAAFYAQNPTGHCMIRNPETFKSKKVTNKKAAFKAMAKLKIK